MIQLDTVVEMTATAPQPPCPKCRNGMLLACITPHPINARMEKHTFICTRCNQTRTYALSVE